MTLLNDNEKGSHKTKKYINTLYYIFSHFFRMVLMQTKNLPVNKKKLVKQLFILITEPIHQLIITIYNQKLYTHDIKIIILLKYNKLT